MTVTEPVLDRSRSHHARRTNEETHGGRAGRWSSGHQATTSTTLGDELDSHRLTLLGRQVDRAVARRAGDLSPQVSAFVQRAIQTFVDHDLDAAASATTMATASRQLGERLAHEGVCADELAQTFRLARSATQQGLGDVVPEGLRHDVLAAVREDVMHYLQELFGHALRGLRLVDRLEQLTPAQCRDRLRDQAFSDGDAVGLHTLAVRCGLDPAAALRPVVAQHGKALDRGLLERTEVVAGRCASEALVPAAWSAEHVTASAGCAVAFGPAVALGDAAEAVRLTRAAAVVADLRPSAPPVVTCEDVLGALLGAANPLLGELLRHKHLEALEELPAQRRLVLGETVLAWLTSGQPVNVLARSLGLATQTLHSRINAARKVFGETLEDAESRLELVLALRLALPAWRQADTA